jgi:PTH1 family peptidyl-tRNA hydrolase
VRLIVGLGNPGQKYVDTRHNTGFQAVNYLAKLNSIPFDRRLCRARIGNGEIAFQKVTLAKPGTYMNLSGAAVKCLINKYSITEQDLLVIYDDVDLELGKIRLKARGGAAGHKGMLSIISSLGTEDFARVKIGIGRPQSNGVQDSEIDIINYVLGHFLDEEKKIMQETIIKAANLVEYYLRNDIDAAMNKFN